MLKENEYAPLDIAALGEQGEEILLNDFLGQYVVLYFYPKDNTPGCTKEACEFRDFNKDISALGVKVLGISKDSVESHQKFKEKHKLNFFLLSDQDGKLAQAFGVNALLMVKRSTFILNNEGKIIKVWSKVNPLGHAKEVYEFLKKELSA